MLIYPVLILVHRENICEDATSNLEEQNAGNVVFTVSLTDMV